MDEFAIKKLAEVQGFLALSGLIRQKAGTELETTTSSIALAFDEVFKLDISQSVPDDYAELFVTKKTKTYDKLSKMMELYIGDEWDNPVEVLEWSSFYAGAAAAHASLASSIVEIHDPKLGQTLASYEMIFRQLLDDVITQLRATAASR